MFSCLNDEMAPEDTELQLLSAATLVNTPEFGLRGLRMRAKVLNVYDGDTITLGFVFRGEVFRKQCRVKGVDCAEIRTRNESEKAVGLRAQIRTRELVSDSIVRVEFDNQEDKYGRLLGVVYIRDGRRLDSVLIEEGLGYAYDGKQKRQFEEWYTRK